MSGAVCAYPGCGAPLGRQGRTGVCPAHVHRPGYCRCAQCRRRHGTVAAVCAYPGCTEDLGGWGESRVCRAHLHAEGVCQCRQCAGPRRSGPDTWLERVSRMAPREAGRTLAAYWREREGRA